MALTGSAAAQNSDRLTMDEVVLGTGVLLPSSSFHWTGDSEIAALGKPEAVPQAGLDVYTKKNNLYYKGTDGVEHAITSYDDPNIVCGSSVSRNEFGIEGGIFISPDSSKVAFYRKDESKVTPFPLLDITTRNGSLHNIKYPMNGMASEVVSLGVYDFKSGKTVWMDVTDFDEDRYLTNITWDPAGKHIFIQVLDRPQKHVHLNCYDAATGAFVKTVLTDEDSRYAEPQYPLYFLKNDPSKFIYTTNCRDGYWNLYLHSLESGETRRLTPVDADVEYAFQNGNYVYYYSWEVSPIERQLFRVSLKNGKMERMTPDKGWHTCRLSPDGKYFSDEALSYEVPKTLSVYDLKGKKVKELLRVERKDLSEKLTNCIIERGTFKSADGKYDNPYSLVKPADFDPAKKYPVVLYVYGGPHSQMISDNYLAGLSRWDILMAQKGYIVITMDNRGTLYHGADYEKAIHKQCGQAEMADQMVGIRWMMAQPWVDASRIGVHGWSYGGFMTISLMVNYPEVFKVAVAGGPVIDWKWYEIMYGERYMETEKTNPEGFEKTSLIPRVKDIKGKLLICQGAMDSTVVWQHSLSFVNECVYNGVQLDYFPYPTHPHNVPGKERVHLMNKVTAYFEDYLK